MQAYDWTQFHVRMYYLAPLEELFRRFSTAAGLESFFIYKAVHVSADGKQRAPDEQVQRGDQYDWTYVHDFGHGGTFEEVVPNQLIRFTFGSMRVDVHFRDLGDATEVDLHQTNCATEDPERAWQHLNCRSCWIYFMTNLRSVLAGGPDVRDYEHPNWNDSVSIGFDPNADPGQPRQG
ncbi:MAG: SRPBCC domain-containing protein [Anaerolineales bacterium]|nr:SRPBCC domain-containing protein [Anaerolineales bacterium]MCA9927886.1 SRPBCC domain-containing protein [Anaerolineales bacterium]